MTAPDKFDLQTEVRDLFEQKLREFAAFCAEHWDMTVEQAMTLTEPTESPVAYTRGYNDAMTHGLEGALEHWLDETGYGR